MSNSSIKNRLSRLVLTIWATLLGFWSLAQDGGGTGGASVNISTETTKSDNWYASPWVWVVGAAVFILLLVALLRGGGRRSD